jgi:2-phosphosulfolactate phosphatase
MRERRLFVMNGRTGAARAARMGALVVIVDALRASATVASMLEHGAGEVLVVEHTAQAFAQHEAQPDALLVGERDGLRVEGFDFGNSPFTEPLPGASAASPRRVIFTSSNCSGCCLAAAQAPAIYLGTTVTAGAVASLLAASGDDVAFVTAGAAGDETRFVLEDHLAAGAIIDRLRAGAAPGNDAAVAALTLYTAAGPAGLEGAFCSTDNGSRLISLGFERDVRIAASLDRFHQVPMRVELRALAGSGEGVLFRSAPSPPAC